MRELFREWKRKLGCVTLVLALAFAAQWIRSNAVLDSVAIAFRQNRYELQSFQQHIRFFHTHIKEGQLGHPFWSCYADPITHLEQPLPAPHDLLGETFLGEDRRVLKIGGLSAGTGSFEAKYRSLLVPKPGPPVRVFQTIALVPHSWIVIPLTLLSTWLLLCRSKAPAKTTVESAAKDGGVTGGKLL